MNGQIYFVNGYTVRGVREFYKVLVVFATQYEEKNVRLKGANFNSVFKNSTYLSMETRTGNNFGVCHITYG